MSRDSLFTSDSLSCIDKDMPFQSVMINSLGIKLWSVKTGFYCIITCYSHHSTSNPADSEMRDLVGQAGWPSLCAPEIRTKVGIM